MLAPAAVVELFKVISRVKKIANVRKNIVHA